MVEVLQRAGCNDFASFDVLTSEAIRQGVVVISPVILAD
jgi:glutaredoxin-related protein